jgi:pimeloyl-ACP methyl ester carboxylesterase
MHYQEFNPSGSKAAILLHGLGANSDSWQFQSAELAQAGYRVIVPDMFGFGKSEYKNKKNTIESMADDVHDLMQRIGVQKANFIGLSMGGAITMKFALKYPEKVEKLVLANTAARFANKVGGKLYTILKRIFVMSCLPRRYGANMVSNFVFPKPEQKQFREEFFNEIMVSNKGAYFDSVKSIIKHDVRAQLGNIDVPTLIIGGSHDYVTPNFLQKAIHEGIKGSKLVIIQGAGHVSAVDSAAEFNKEMLDFLR